MEWTAWTRTTAAPTSAGKLRGKAACRVNAVLALSWPKIRRTAHVCITFDLHLPKPTHTVSVSTHWHSVPLSLHTFFIGVLVVVFYNSHDSKVLSLCFIDLILLRWCISATKDQNVPVINICNSNEWTNSTGPPVVKYTVGHLIPKSAKRFKPSWRCWRIQKSDFMSFCNSVPVSHSSHLENFGLLFLMGESELSLTMFGKSSPYTFRQWEY